MDLKEAMNRLKQEGTAQNVKVYRRHGAKGTLFGASFAGLGKLKKVIGTDHNLAGQLWATGNVDAMSLATMIADPKKISSAEADRWIRDIDYYMLSDLFAGMVAQSPLVTSKMKKWMSSKKEFIRQTGYSLLATGLKNGIYISDGECRSFIKTIESEIHLSPNRARHAMNNALIAVGVFKPTLADEAIAAARRIGKVDVDHGETSCKTPDAAAYISKSLSRRKR